MKEDWKKQMQEKMADYHFESDIDLSWREIEEALATNRRKAKTAILWSRGIAAAVSILLLSGVGYWWNLSHQDSATETEKMMVQSVCDNKPIAKDVIQQTDMPTKQNVTVSKYVTSSPDSVVEETLGEVESEEREAKTETATEEKEEQQQLQERNITPTPVHHNTIYPSDLRQKPTSNRLTAKVYFSNTMAGSSSFQTLAPAPSDKDNSNMENPQEGTPGNVEIPGGDTTLNPDEKNTDEEENDDKASTRNLTRADNGNTQMHENVRHHQPIRFGISFRYRLNDRWNLESGLTYTHLSSDITKTYGTQDVNIEQNLSYIGIPINASYLLWGNRHFNFYLSAGMMVEKMVKGSRKSQGITNSVSIHPLQLSINGAAGAEFRLNKLFSIYAEPGLGYFFDNGSSIPTIYQDKPLNFNLSVGFRLCP